MFKKFLLFFSIALVLVGSLVGVYFKYIHSFEYQVFIESYEHGMLSVANGNAVGTDSKYRVTCKSGETLIVNINPERTESAYYTLDRLTVNGADVTDDVRMLQYRFKVKKNSNVIATFKKGARPTTETNAQQLDYPSAPAISPLCSTPYLGSAGAYNFRDPSIIFDKKSGYYYAFGSDNAVARSKDLLNWTSRTTYFDTPVSAESSEVMDFSQFRCVRDWAKAHGYNSNLTYSSVLNDRTPLAPDIVKVDDTYYLYFSLSKTQGANESAIFCVSTKDLEASVKNKKWDEVGLVVSSCGYHRDSKLEDGKTKATDAHYDESNAVHPSVILTDDEKMYLVYGSYFGRDTINGGIYLLELDRNTGLLKTDSDINSVGEKISTVHKYGEYDFHAGVLLAKPGRVPSLSKSDGSLVSACDIFYRDGYYYLFITYGVEEKNYEIRAAKSRKIDGPYLDESGNSLSEFSSSKKLNQYSKGELLAAGYSFTRSRSGKVSYTNSGKASPGSPCVIKTEDGKYVMALQSQLYFKADGKLMTGQTEADRNELSVDALPSLELRQLKWTKDGRPLLVPEAYVGEKLEKTVTAQQMFGNWDVVVFEKGANESDYTALSCNSSQVVSLFNGVTISRNDIESGRALSDLYFAKKDKDSFEIELDGKRFVIYPVLAWDSELSEGTLCFTGSSADGEAVWGKKTFSPYMGIYTDTFYYLLSLTDEATHAEYDKKLEKISANPSQEQLDKLSAELVKKLQVQTLR